LREDVFRRCVRIARAKEMLARGRSVTETCFDVGFSSVGSFSTLFSRQVRSSPRAFQASVRSIVNVPDRVGVIVVPFCFAQHFAPVP
jgi:AraC-like DNA-binding protein